MTTKEAIEVLGEICSLYVTTGHPQGRVEALELAIKALRGEPVAAQRDQLLKEVEGLRSERNAEREKVEKLKEFAQSDYGLCFPAFYEKILDLWPDSKPAPAPQMWDWAYKELLAGRRVRWNAWTETSYLALIKGELHVFSGGCPEGMLWKPLQKHILEAGWLPYEDKK